MGDLAQVNEYLKNTVRVVGRNNRDGTFSIYVTIGGVTVLDKDYVSEVEFVSDLRSIRNKFTVIDDYIWELTRG